MLRTRIVLLAALCCLTLSCVKRSSFPTGQMKIKGGSGGPLRIVAFLADEAR